MKKYIRLIVASLIRHDEEYYKTAMESNGINPKELNHHQISIYKASIKVIEADTLIEVCFKQPVTEIKKGDIESVQPRI